MIHAKKGNNREINLDLTFCQLHLAVVSGDRLVLFFKKNKLLQETVLERFLFAEEHSPIRGGFLWLRCDTMLAKLASEPRSLQQ